MAANTVFRVYNGEDDMLSVYRRRLDIADRIYKQGEAQLKRYVARYENVAETDQYTSRGHRVNVTSGIGVIDTLYSSMTAVDVEFILKNVGHGTRVQATAAERALNQGWADTKGQNRSKKAIKDAQLVDIGWVKVYYDYVEDVELRDKPDEAVRSQVEEIRRERPDIDDAELVTLLNVVDEVPIVLRDRVCVDYVPWDMIRHDSTAKQIEDVRWVAQYTKLPVPEVTHNPQWRAFVLDRYGEKKGKAMLADLQGDTSVLTALVGRYDDLESLGHDEHEDDQRLTVVEMWDLETGLVTVFPRQNEDLVLFQRLNPLMFNLDLEDRNPFKPLVVRDDPERLAGLGDMRVIWPSLEELDEYRTNLATHISRTIPKLLGPARAMTASGKKALQSQEWGEYVGLEEGVDASAVQPLTPPPLPQEAFQMQERIQFEMKDATGASEPMRGVFPSRRTTATETEIVTSAGEQRQAERRSALEQWYLSIAQTMLQLMQLFYTQDRMTRYTDDLGQEFVWTWNNEDIAIEADLEISLTPKENLTRAERVQRALQWMNLALALPETDRAEVLKFVGKEMGFRDEDIRAMVKSQQEVQAEEQQAQVAAQLAVKPQPFANSPQGLSISGGGGGG